MKEKKQEKVTFYLLVSLVTFILHVFSYVPLYVIYLYMYTYVHTLSLRITSLFFSLSPFQLLFLSLYYSIYIPSWSFSTLFIFLLFYRPWFSLLSIQLRYQLCLPVFDHTSLIWLVSPPFQTLYIPFLIACLSFSSLLSILSLCHFLVPSLPFYLSTCVFVSVISDSTAAAYCSREKQISTRFDGPASLISLLYDTGNSSIW